jgi:uncharacterized protein (TIGR03086 family)
MIVQLKSCSSLRFRQANFRGGVTMELFAALEGAVASTAEIVKTAQGQLDAPTPCAEWDVRALLNHVIGTLWLAEGLFSDQPPRYPMVPGGLPPADLAAGDPAVAYAEAAAAALAAAGAGDALTRVHPTPLGDMPGPGLAGFTTLDILVHGWDLARATGQPADLDGRLAAHVLGFAGQALATQESRAGRIGPALTAPDGATVTSQLVAFLGRQP